MSFPCCAGNAASQPMTSSCPTSAPADTFKIKTSVRPFCRYRQSGLFLFHTQMRQIMVSRLEKLCRQKMQRRKSKKYKERNHRVPVLMCFVLNRYNVFWFCSQSTGHSGHFPVSLLLSLPQVSQKSKGDQEPAENAEDLGAVDIAAFRLVHH